MAVRTPGVPAMLGRVARKRKEALRARRLAAAATRHLTPPHPSRFGSFGERSVIGAPARVTSPERIFIGDDVVINEYSWISVVEAVEGYVPTLTIGDGTLIDRLIHIACVGEISIGKDVLIGERVLIGDTYHGYEDVGTPILQQPMVVPRPVSIGDGVGIGIGACIMPGVTIGQNASIAAGSVVNRDVPARSVVAGNPARVVRTWDEERQRW